MKYGYARVSTRDQTLAPQEDALRTAGCDQIFSDFGVSGATNMRDGIDECLSALTPGDTLVVTKLDRLGRTLSYLVALIDELGRQGIHFQSLGDGIDTTSATGRLQFGIMAALAEYERALISERTKAGLAAAKKRGAEVGRPRGLSSNQTRKAIIEVAEGRSTYKELAELFDVHHRTVRRAVKDRIGKLTREDLRDADLVAAAQLLNKREAERQPFFIDHGPNGKLKPISMMRFEQAVYEMERDKLTILETALGLGVSTDAFEAALAVYRSGQTVRQRAV